MVIQEVNINQDVPNNKSIFEEIVEGILESISEEYFIEVHSVLLVPRGSIPKAQGGKIKRNSCKEAMLENKLTTIAIYNGEHSLKMSQKFKSEFYSNAEKMPDQDQDDREDYIFDHNNNTVQQRLKEVFSEILFVSTDAIEETVPFSRFNMNSMQLLLIAKEIEASFKISFSVTSLFKFKTIKSIDEYLEQQLREEPVG